jgi:hypothetical protein
MNAVGLAQFGHFFDPQNQFFVGGVWIDHRRARHNTILRLN